jgi:integrase
MTKKAAGLTARRVETAKTPGLLADGGGLYLQVTPSGAKTWIYRFQRSGRRRDMGLGSVVLYSLAEARRKAADARRLVAEGIDPIEQRAALAAAEAATAAKAMTFEDAARAYIKAHQAGWRSPKSLAAWTGTLGTFVYPTLGALPVQLVDVGLVMKAIEPIWATKPETASRVRGRIEAVLDWATTRGYRSGENPARWRGHLENLLPKKNKIRRVAHHAALPYAKLSDFMTELREQQGVAARALEFAILTAARTAEVIGARWDEINLAECLWTIPADRMKAGRRHRVPLSGSSLAVLERMAAIRQNAFVFPGDRPERPISNMSMLMLLRRMGIGDFTVHGFRSTFSDWCAEQTTTPSEVREMALAHAVPDEVEAAYRRGDLFEKRRQLAEAWARFCKAPPAARRVVPIRPTPSDRPARRRI